MRTIPPPSPHRAAHASGYTLLALAAAVAIASLLAAAAVPLGRHWLIKSRAHAVADDLRVFSAALQAYAAAHGDWPAGDGTPGAAPAGMDAQLAKTDWSRPTPIGGYYAWDPQTLQQGSRYRAAIVLVSARGSSVSADAAQLVEIDRQVDDANLSTGVFLLGYREYPFYVLEH